MHYFEYKDNELYCEEVPLKKIATEIGTPCYIYSARTLRRHFKAYEEPLKNQDHLVCYSVKANTNLSILKLLSDMRAGFDIVSEGELFRVIKAGGDPKKVVFSGVGKTQEEMEAALHHQIYCFNVESVQELEKLNGVAKSLHRWAPVSLRVNPDIDPKTHPYIATGLKENKFGIPLTEAIRIYQKKYSNIQFIGLDCHIGSQMLTLKPIIETLKVLGNFIRDLKKSGIILSHLNLGGGLGIRYKEESPPHPKIYIETIIRYTQDLDVKLVFEPGRTIVGNAGILLTTVLYIKKTPHKSFVIVDSAMNDLIRPALYDAYQDIWTVIKTKKGNKKVDVVGPICESGDFLAKNRVIGKVYNGALLAVMSAGAYGFSMASNYNSRRLPAEVLVDGSAYKICRQRQTYDDLIRGEILS